MAEPAWKPIAAGLLVVAAVAMIGRNLVGPRLGKDESSVAEPVTTESVAEPLPQTTEAPTTDTLSGATTLADPAPAPIPAAGSTDTSLLSDWIVDPGRDPFGTDPRKTSTPKTPTRRDETASVPAKNSATRHKLTAIAWGSGKLALVDGIPVGIGDSLLGGRVVDIRSDRLVLQRGTSDTLLRFWEGRKP